MSKGLVQRTEGERRGEGEKEERWGRGRERREEGRRKKAGMSRKARQSTDHVLPQIRTRKRHFISAGMPLSVWEYIPLQDYRVMRATHRASECTHSLLCWAHTHIPCTMTKSSEGFHQGTAIEQTSVSFSNTKRFLLAFLVWKTLQSDAYEPGRQAY